MARYTGPVCKLCRRDGVKLFLKGEKCFLKCTLERRPNPPGSSTAPKRRRNLSAYGVRFREKQKLKRMAGILERQMRRYFKEAARQPGRTGEALLRILETRLDNVVRKVGLATSLRFARELVTHGHVRLNGRKVTIPSINVRPGNKIEIEPSMKDNTQIKLALENFGRRASVIPNWISWDQERGVAQILRLPEASELNLPVTDQYIVEFYTRR